MASSTISAEVNSPDHQRASTLLWTWARPRLPLLVFAATYVLTCYVGMLALIVSSRFRTLYLIFSGADVPDLTWRDLIVCLSLAHFGPLLLWAGYELALLTSRRLQLRRTSSFVIDEPHILIVRCLFGASVVAALWSLERTGGLAQNFAAWLDYNSYVYTRFRLADRLTFLEFVNLYTWLPLLCAYIVLLDRRVAAIVSVVLVVLLEYALASRKVILASGILIGTAFYVYRYFGERARRPLPSSTHIRIILIGPLCLFIVYLGLTVVTVLRPTSSVFQSIASLVPKEQLEAARRRRALREQRRREQPHLPLLQRNAVISDIEEDLGDILKNRVASIALYTFLSPFTRTSISGLTYSALFPQEHPFYRIDLALDVLRVGTMPDENLVAYRILWPRHHRGAIGAPFQFVLYTQGGVWVAFAGAFALGLLLGGSWLCVTAAIRPGATTSIFAGLVTLFSAFVAIDSIRNSLIVSYGVGWGVLALLVVSASTFVVHAPGSRAVV